MSFGGGFLGSGEKTTTSSTYTTTDVDNISTEADDSMLNVINVDSAGAATVTTTDFGAIDTAGNIAEESFTFADRANELASAAITSAAGVVKQAGIQQAEIAAAATQDEAARTQQLLIIAAIVLGAVIILRPTLSKVLK